MSEKRRKVIFINRPFQFKVIGYFIGLAVISIGIFFSANLWFFQKFKNLGVEMNLDEGHVFFQFINAQQVQMNWIYFFVSLGVVAILFTAGAILSHRVAGPFHQLVQHLKEYNKGNDPEPLVFRHDDFFTEIPEHVNAALYKVASYNSKNSEEKKAS